MWVIIKYKPNELNLLKESFEKVLGNKLEFYIPKIRYERIIKNKNYFFEKNLLENYLICKHENFKHLKYLQLLQNSRGLSYFLDGFQLNQAEIENFVSKCKNHEDNNGYLKQSFFDFFIKNKIKFISGPFANMIFEVIHKNKDRIKILFGNKTANISATKNCLYVPG